MWFITNQWLPTFIKTAKIHFRPGCVILASEEYDGYFLLKLIEIPSWDSIN